MAALRLSLVSACGRVSAGSGALRSFASDTWMHLGDFHLCWLCAYVYMFVHIYIYIYMYNIYIYIYI